jgi:hypothetical protein
LENDEYVFAVKKTNSKLTAEVRAFSTWSDYKIPSYRLNVSAKNDSCTDTEIFNVALNIVRLLSLATGHSVTFNIQEYCYGENKWEVWRTQMSDFKHIPAIVPDDSITEYLTTVLLNKNSLTTKKTEALDTIIHYINGLNDGYVEDRLRIMVVCFEILADNENFQFHRTENLKELTMGIKQAYRVWLKQHPESDKNGFLLNRMTNSLDWDKAMSKIAYLLELYKIDTRETQLDLDRWIKLRDEVTHTGRFKDYSDIEYVVNQLHFGTDILRIILLLQLGYLGQVNWFENRFHKRSSISQLIK